MYGKKPSIRPAALLAVFAASALLTGIAARAQETVLHNFNLSSKDGYRPMAGLVFDSAGNLYGTTYFGGTYAHGTVFELSPTAGGGWKERILHSFSGGVDGESPYASLTFDASGNLYGTTAGGGSGAYGTAFELTPTAGGKWVEKILYNFGSSTSDGHDPVASLIFDASGNLYGTTQSGGTYGVFGTVFELTRKGSGVWAEKILHNFNDNGLDGYQPLADLIFDATGNLYGTTDGGGSDGYGTVFQLKPRAGGGWTEKVLHSFAQSEGIIPSAGLILDALGNLYGTAMDGGAYGRGAVFELTPSEGGAWSETTLYAFTPTLR